MQNYDNDAALLDRLKDLDGEPSTLVFLVTKAFSVSPLNPTSICAVEQNEPRTLVFVNRSIGGKSPNAAYTYIRNVLKGVCRYNLLTFHLLD